jgi:hypothetical protein
MKTASLLEPLLATLMCILMIAILSPIFSHN